MIRLESRISKLVSILVGPSYRVKDGKLKAFLSELEGLFSLMNPSYKDAMTTYYLGGGVLEEQYQKQHLHHGRAILASLVRQATGTCDVAVGLGGYVEEIEIESLLQEDGMVRLADLNNHLFGSPDAMIIRRAVTKGSLSIEIVNGYLTKKDAEKVIKSKKRGELDGRTGGE